MINDFYNLLFFHFYKSFIKIGETSTPVASGLLVLSFVLFMNLMAILSLIDIFGISVDGYLSSMNKIHYPLITGGVIFSLNFLYVYHEKRYEKIIKEYSKRSLEQRKKGARITLFYALGSILLVFILAPLRVM